MTNPTIQIFNGETGQVIERDMTEDESSEFAEFQAQAAADQAEKEAKELARTSALAKLAALGLTEEEIAAL